MLQRLSIKNFVLIEELTIEFGPDFSVITGETGAGKSIILGAIGLLMGQRADSSTLLAGADRCTIEAQFTGLDDAVGRMLEEEDVDHDDTECIIRREINAKGKSRAFVNDTPASLQLLKRLSEYLIDIHSQHQNLLLGDAQFQLSVLDLYGGHTELLNSYQDSYRTYRTLSGQLQEARLALEALRKEQDYLQYQYTQLEEAELEEGELEELTEEERQLSHAQEIRDELQQATSALSEEEHGAIPAVTYALRSVEAIRSYHAGAEEWSERLHSVRIELQDLVSTLEDEAEGVTFSPKRLARVGERLDLLRGLLHRHSLREITELIALRDRLAQELERIDSSDEELHRLEQSVEESYQALLEQGQRLREARQSAAHAIEGALIASLHELGMPHVRFMIRMEEHPIPTAMGLDQVTYLFSANKDTSPEPVANIASGGEISRLMLALKALIADRRSLPTIIFDEIDTGVSGETAERIAVILRRMGSSMQVMAVTHLPQIAAAGINHFYIYKEHGADSTRSHLRHLSEEERVEEIARMQSGSQLTEVTRAAARALLETFHSPRRTTSSRSSSHPITKS
nr:DNA repair protein RecN [uncultured Porphyromonas sp.]